MPLVIPFLVKIPLHLAVTPVRVLGIALCDSDEERKRWPETLNSSVFRKKRWKICKSVSVWLSTRTDGSPLIFSVLINFGVVSVLIGKCGMLLLCSTGLHCICQVLCSFCAGVEPMQVQETVENHLKSLLIKHFDPRKADSIFTEEGEVCMQSLLLSLQRILPRLLHLMEWWREIEPSKLFGWGTTGFRKPALSDWSPQRFRELGNLECNLLCNKAL